MLSMHVLVFGCLFILMEGVVTSVLRGSARDRYKVDAALKYCKAFLCTLKGKKGGRCMSSCLTASAHNRLCMQHAYNTVANIAHAWSLFHPICIFLMHRCLAGNHMRVHKLSPQQSSFWGSIASQMSKYSVTPDMQHFWSVACIYSVHIDRCMHT